MAFQSPQISSLYHNKQLTSPVAVIVLLVMIIVLFSWFILKPKMSSVSAQHGNLKTLKSQLSAVDNEKRELNRLVAQLADSKDEVTLTDEALPLSGRTSKVHVLVDNLAKASGLVISQITAEDVDDIISAGNKEVLKDPYKPQRKLYTSTVTVSVAGTVDQFKNFLELLETNGRVLDISQLEIIGDEGSTKFRVKIKSYSYEVI